MSQSSNSLSATLHVAWARPDEVLVLVTAAWGGRGAEHRDLPVGFWAEMSRTSLVLVGGPEQGGDISQALLFPLVVSRRASGKMSAFPI